MQLLVQQVVTDILHLHEKRVHTFRGNYTEYLEAASDLDNNKFRENTQMFIDKNKHKYDMIPRVVAAMRMLNNLPVLEKEPVDFVLSLNCCYEDFISSTVCCISKQSELNHKIVGEKPFTDIFHYLPKSVKANSLSCAMLQ